MKHHFQVEAELWWSQWLVPAVSGIQLDWRMAADVLLTSQACLVGDILGDHLVVEKVDDEEAEMVLIGRILSDRMAADVLLTSQACLVGDILGDHLVVEKVDDEEAEMVLIGRILSDRMPAEVPLTSQASLVDNLLGDHLVLEQVDDEEAEMVLMGRILSEKPDQDSESIALSLSLSHTQNIVPSQSPIIPRPASSSAASTTAMLPFAMRPPRTVTTAIATRWLDRHARGSFRRLRSSHCRRSGTSARESSRGSGGGRRRGPCRDHRVWVQSDELHTQLRGRSEPGESDEEFLARNFSARAAKCLRIGTLPVKSREVVACS
ncbi:hypothetical protein NL676_035237 [Syzygium grande]|nr:hypothetical protein NL676_035237 [Syzygium grande]